MMRLSILICFIFSNFAAAHLNLSATLSDLANRTAENFIDRRQNVANQTALNGTVVAGPSDTSYLTQAIPVASTIAAAVSGLMIYFYCVGIDYKRRIGSAGVSQ